MAQIREIKKRIKAVANIRRITKTMQMIATSKFARAQQRAEATKPYTEGVFELVQELAATAGNVSHPLIDGPGKLEEGAGEVTLIVTSDRGLCGPYNGSVLRSAMAELRSRETPDRVVELVGKKGVSFLRFNGVAVARHHSQFGDKPDFEEVQRLAQEYIDLFTAGRITGVRVIYMRYVSVGRQTPETLQLLPLKPPAIARTGGLTAQYEFSPPAEELLDALLPQAVKATLFQCFNDAVVSEHIARMVAMKAATDSAGRMIRTLTRRYNRARQTQITMELLDIVGGANALT